MAESGKLKGRRAVVTGAGGFIGGAVSRRLAAEGAEVVGLDVDPGLAGRVEAQGATFKAVDVTEAPAVEAALEGAEVVVHAAAFVRDWGTMEEFVEVNVGGTVNVLDAAERAGAKWVIHISSVVVYGYEYAGEQDEDAPRRTYGIPYIDTKSASDRIACNRGAIVIRPGDVYGPGSVPWTVRPIELAKAGQLAVPSPGDGRMLPLYVDDLADAVLLAAERGEPGRPYTAWSGEHVTFKQFFDSYARMVGGHECRVLPRPLLSALAGAMESVARLRGRPPALTPAALTFIDRRGTVSTERIRSELGWEPKIMLEEGMRRTEEWARATGSLTAGIAGN